MRRHGSWIAILLALLASPAWAQDMACPPEEGFEPEERDVACKVKCKDLERISYAPTMFGDFLTLAFAPAMRDAQVTPGATPYGFPIDRGGYKIAENEAPRPQNRVFGSYNFYDQVPGPRPLDAVHREITGAEMTFCDGNASIGFRQPFYQAYGKGFESNGMEDAVGILKVLVCNNPKTGSLISVGVLGAGPTGRNAFALAPDGSQIKPFYIEPFLGYFWGWGRFYAHGFTSVMIPTDGRDVTVLSNDIGIGYSVYQDTESTISAVIPTIEVHVNSPVNHAIAVTALNYQDTMNFTGGVHFIFNQRSSLGLAVGTPVFGPSAFNIEALANFNYRF